MMESKALALDWGIKSEFMMESKAGVVKMIND
jgi:hypothetical protein